MFKKLLALSIILFCAIVWAQDVSNNADVKKNEDVLVKPSIGDVKVEVIEPPNNPRGVHTRMNVQGYLLYNNAPVNGSVPIIFSIWDAYTAGNKLWGDEVDTVNCNNGLFNFLIGSKIPINPSVFTGGTYRTLQMVVNGATMPRIIITTVGWAFSAGKSDSSAWAYNSDRVDNYHAGNSSGQIPISNGTVCTNLNADLLDGLHSSSFLTTSSDYGRSGVATNLYEGTSTLTSKYVNEGQANSITSSMIVDGTIQTVDCAFTVGDITGVSAGDGLTGGGTSGSVTLNVGAGTGIDVTADAVSVEVPLNLSGSSTSYIIRAYNSSSGAALLGNSSGGNGIFGQSDGDDGVYGVSNNSSYSGMYGTAYAGGVAGYANGSSGDRHGGLFWSNGGGTAYVGARIGGTNYKIYGSGNVSCVMPTHQGDKVLFAPESPEPYFEDFGQGQLINGYCHIALDPLFLDCIKTDTNHPLKVFVQLNDNCNGVYVKVGQTGFDVYELQDGTSSAAFTYRVVANRKDTDYLRFPPGSISSEMMRVHGEKGKYKQGGKL